MGLEPAMLVVVTAVVVGDKHGRRVSVDAVGLNLLPEQPDQAVDFMDRGKIFVPLPGVPLQIGFGEIHDDGTGMRLRRNPLVCMMTLSK